MASWNEEQLFCGSGCGAIAVGKTLIGSKGQAVIPPPKWIAVYDHAGMLDVCCSNACAEKRVEFNHPFPPMIIADEEPPPRTRPAGTKKRRA